MQQPTPGGRKVTFVDADVSPHSKSTAAAAPQPVSWLTQVCVCLCVYICVYICVCISGVAHARYATVVCRVFDI